MSGVLAAVTVGFYHGRRQSQLISAATRIQTFSFWEMLVFLINAGLFIVVGLQLPGILEGLRGSDQRDLLLAAVAVTAVVIAVRVIWVGGFTLLLRGLDSSRRWAQPVPGRYALVIGATGMRGAVSLAAALAVPLEIEGGQPFPERDLLLFLAFAVIVATLVPQGLALPWLLRRLDLLNDEEVDREEARPGGPSRVRPPTASRSFATRTGSTTTSPSASSASIPSGRSASGCVRRVAMAPK